MSLHPDNLLHSSPNLTSGAGLTRDRTLQGNKAESLRRLFTGKTVTYPTKGGVVHVLFAFDLWNRCGGIHITAVSAGYLEYLQ